MFDIRKAVIQKMDQIGAKYLLLQFTGADGHLKGVEISKRSFSKVDQVGVDGSSIGFLRTKQSDMIIVPDPSTVTLVPWQENTACVFCDLRSTDETHERIAADPRGILAEASKELYDEFQATYFARPEMEFYILTSDFKPADSATYMVLPPRDKGYFLRKMIVQTLEQVDIPYKTFHSEVGPGQHEIEFDSLPAVRAADSVQYFKQIAKMVALNQSEWIISFMPKPFITEAGNGMHIHQIVNTSSEEMFKGSGNELSEFALHFIAGQLHFAGEITAITNPIINSYRRLVPGKEAPVYKTWGIANRTALIRVPGYEAGRLEYRAADAATNIYFTLAFLLKAGLEGVRRNLEPPEEANFDADTLSLKQLEEKGVELLPRSLKDALMKFKASTLAKKILGSALHQEYYEARMSEWMEFSNEYSFEKQEITPWEISHYLDC
ncbi:MAG: glutamine synthetase [Candidatus Heimdallarchaeota archaeon]|nr:MAG: glutamine synthetase [Candidatus Heimdallarchaeota archaeon]